MQKQFPFWILTITVSIALILPILLQNGMFMDGLLYACISNNLANGIGSFWYPHFSKTIYPFFDQQPPLAFWIQSWFFKILGESIYVERIYSFITACVTGYLIHTLFRIIFKNDQAIKRLSWLPVLFWIITPVCFWSYSNNMLENTMAIFDLLAIIFIAKFIQHESFLFVILSGVFIFLASLTKGFPGLFPLATIFVGWVVYKNCSFMKMIFYTLLLLLIPVTIYFILLQCDHIFQSITTYLHNRVLNSIQHVALVGNRFHILVFLLSELLPDIILITIILVISKCVTTKAVENISFPKKHLMFFLFIAISATFPLMITLEQRGAYLVTAMPYYAIVFALISAPIVSLWIERINIQQVSFRILRTVSILILVVVMCFSFLQIGKIGRDVEMIHDVRLIGSTVPNGAILGSTRELWEIWSLQEYIVRHYYICQRDRITSDDDYLLLKEESQISSDMKIEKVNIPTTKYHLYKVIK